MTDAGADVAALLAAADASYRPIPRFDGWLTDGVDLSEWDNAKATLGERRAAADPAVVGAALQERLRAAAVDTGALEGLYTTSRGFTRSVAELTISLDQAEVEKGADFRRNYEAQLEGFEMALDVATRAVPITESLIRQIHEVTCAGQRSYRVLTPLGVQERPLTLGTYKEHPNHVQLGDGTFHAYAPVSRVAEEMHRLIEELRSPAFEAAHPVVQAAYAHHALTWIHPFPDGNGRVARLLASIWLLRSASIPLWIDARDSTRTRYLDALAAADDGDPDALVDVIARANLGVLRGISTSLSAALAEVEGRLRKGLRNQRATVAADLATELTARLAALATGDVAASVESLGDLELGDRDAITWIEAPQGSSWLVAVGLDWQGPPTDRLVVVMAEVDHFGRPTLVWPVHERFDEDDLLPEITEAAGRRVLDVARLIVGRTHGS